MSTIRRRKPRFEFVQILNAVARDYRVSWRARGLLTELLSYPENYETTVDELVKKAKRSGGNVEGRDAMRKAARELKDVGYIVETRYQNELGHWITEQEVTDDPMYDLMAGRQDVSAGRTDDGFSGVGKPGVGKPGVIKKTEKKTEKNIPPPPPSFQRGSDVAEVGKEEEISTQPKNAPKILDRAQKLVDDAVRLWPRHHKAPSARDHQRLSERVAVELENGGDETVIVHELSRDMQDAGQAMRVIMGDRTTVPGWGRVADPRPDHSQYEISNPGHPWCGRCDERTRLIGVYDRSTGETLPGRCRTPVVDHRGETVACNPRTTPSLPSLPDDTSFDNEGQEEDLSPDEFAAMSKASLENPKASRSELLEAARAKMAEGSEKVKAGKGSR